MAKQRKEPEHSIDPALPDELLKGKNPKELFGSDGLLHDLKRALF